MLHNYQILHARLELKRKQEDADFSGASGKNKKIENDNISIINLNFP